MIPRLDRAPVAAGGGRQDGRAGRDDHFVSARRPGDLRSLLREGGSEVDAPGGPPGALRVRLAEAAERHPEGTLFLLLAILCHHEGNSKEALEFAERALATPSLINIRLVALKWALWVEASLHDQDRKNYLKARAAIVRERLRRLLSENGLTPDVASSMMILADAIGDRELARSLALEHVRLAPEDSSALSGAALIESKCGHHSRAVKLMERAMTLEKSRDQRDLMGKYLARMRADLKEEAAKLTADPEMR